MIEQGQMWRHVKRGSVYFIMAVDAHIQTAFLEKENPLLAAEMEAADWIAYTDGKKIFFRMREEFLDGRFVRVTGGEDSNKV